MKFDAAQITRLARDTGFLADNLEKVPRLRELLIELHKHPFLKGKLVLKGGTALNLFYLGLARLSVDIDLNYIAHVGRDATLRERPDIIKAVEQVASGLGYKLQNGTDDYALRERYLNYENHTGNPIESKLKSISSCGLVRSRQGYSPPRLSPACRSASFSSSKRKSFSGERSRP
jgi:predicted nucleotidyltransferase component of viral defense system